MNLDLLQRIVREEEGQDLIEYALIVGLISVVAYVALTATGNSIKDMFNAIATKVETLSGTVAGA